MERKSYYLIILVIALVICIGVFYYQSNNDVPTFMIINETEVSVNSSFSGTLMDAYGQGVANKTITYHKPGNGTGTLANITTDNNGEFTITNAEYFSGAGSDNYYGNFTFAGEGKYLGCTYEANVNVVVN